jgi:hypothetical protein
VSFVDSEQCRAEIAYRFVGLAYFDTWGKRHDWLVLSRHKGADGIDREPFVSARDRTHDTPDRGRAGLQWNRQGGDRT